MPVATSAQGTAAPPRISSVRQNRSRQVKPGHAHGRAGEDCQNDGMAHEFEQDRPPGGLSAFQKQRRDGQE